MTFGIERSGLVTMRARGAPGHLARVCPGNTNFRSALPPLAFSPSKLVP